jgi:pimeloyl-ACP methyl ester carboxylesterase
MRRRTFVELSAAAAAFGAFAVPVSAQDTAASLDAISVADLRFGFTPLPLPKPGYDPAGDAKALFLPGTPSPAKMPVSGYQYTGSYAANERFVVRVPDRWNGNLIVAGTPATRSEYANDFIWGELALARGYAFASSNKGIPYNAIAESAEQSLDRTTAYPIPFDAGGLASKHLTLRFGMLNPAKVGIAAWNDDYATLVEHTRMLLTHHHRKPKRVYAVGLSNGGAQVRSLLERHPDLVDGGVEWSGVYWSPQRSLLDQLPHFLHDMPAYVASTFNDPAIAARLEAAGFPADVHQADPAHPSLYGEYYSNVAPFYADLTVFAYALLIDPAAHSTFDAQDGEPNPNPRLPGTIHGTGLGLPAARAAYVPSQAARDAIGAFAHTGAIGKPLVSIAGTRDAFITPSLHAVGYAQAVAAAKASALHRLFLVDGGTHVDTFAAFGYGLRAQAPFAWAAFEKLVRIVEHGETTGAGETHTVTTPAEIR